MSALAGVFGPAAGSSGPVLQDMFAAMRNRAAGVPESAEVPGGRLGAARHDWEATLSGWSGPLVVQDDRWVVAADATLYYLPDLRRRLGLTRGESHTGQLLILALHRWGPLFAEHLEGDYAIMAWDRQQGRLLLARDFGGRRNLVYARAGHSLIVATSANAVVRHPDVSAEYDPGFIAASASGIIGPGARTAHRQVAEVPAGCTMSIERTTVEEIARWAPPPAGSAWETEPAGAAAEELRFLLQNATKERLAATGPTTVWMSGGWDSTSVFASACAAVRTANEGPASRRVLPISMTYPSDDIGNEDAHIRAVAERWGAPIKWIEADQIPLLADSDRRALLHDDPMIQPFESKMRRLSQLSRELESRIALDGFGGDQVFLVSSAAVIADHVFYGRWTRLWKEWDYLSVTAKEFARMALLPNLSPEVRTWIGVLRGRSMDGFWDRGFPAWIVDSPSVQQELLPEFDRGPTESAAQFETRKSLGTSLIGRAMSWNVAFGLDEGVQLRAPLFDQRVIAFGVSRPLSDRGGGGDSKRILRRAMTGLIPDSVLAARMRKTGTPAGYFRRQFQAQVRPEVDRLFAHRTSHLERLGVLDRKAFLAATDEYASKGVHGLGAMLQLTLGAERWLAVRNEHP